MTEILQSGINAIQKLPRDKQDQIGTWLLSIAEKDDAISELLTTEKPIPSFEDIRHLAGSYKNLPPDLSSNPGKYMQGFGAKSMGLKD